MGIVLYYAGDVDSAVTIAHPLSSIGVTRTMLNWLR